MQCISTLGQFGRMSGTSTSLIQLNWMLVRVVKWPKPLSYLRAIWASLRIWRDGQRAIGHGDAQHIGVQLQIEAVHQPERLELIFGQLAGEAACHLTG